MLIVGNRFIIATWFELDNYVQILLNGILVNVKYVHRLQNLMFELTGEELKRK